MAVSTKGIEELFAVKLYLATWIRDYTQEETLTKIKAKKRLLSYAHIKEKNEEKYICSYYLNGTIHENILSKHRTRP